MSSTPQPATTTLVDLPPILDEPILEENWEEKRRRYIGGSDCASMFADPSLPDFGKDGIKYGCARRLVYQKRGQEPDYPHTIAEEELFSRGHELEPLAASKFRIQNGLGFKLRKGPSHRMSPTHPHAGVNMDYEIVGVTSDQILNAFGCSTAVKGPGYLECKSANEFVFEQITQKGINIDYVFQMQHGLAVKRWEWGIFNVLGFGAGLWRLKWFPMVANKTLGARILQRTKEIWDMVEDRAMMPPPLPQPDPEDRCSECQFRKTCLAESFIPAMPGDGVYHLREDLQDTMVRYRLAKEAAEAAEAERKKAGKELMEVIERKGKFKSLPVLLHKDDKQPVELLGTRHYRLEEHIDTAALREAEAEICKKYMRPVPKDYIQITIRGQKEV